MSQTFGNSINEAASTAFDGPVEGCAAVASDKIERAGIP